MSELGPEARALLDSTREGDDPNELDRARVRSRLNLAIATAAGGAAATATAKVAATNAGVGAQLAAGAQAVAATSVSAKIGVALTVAAISVASTGVVLKHEPAAAPRETHARAAAPAPKPRVKPRVLAEPSARVVAPLVAPLVAPMIEAPPIEAPRIQAQPSKRVLGARAEERAPITPSLQTELDLLSSAQIALRDGDDDRVLSLLAVHAARYPNGVLALEREAVRAIALCNAGRRDEGHAVVERLAPRLSKSPLAARIERACEEK